MDEVSLRQMAMQNLPSQICPLTKMPIREPAVMHRDLSDWWPSSLHDMRDDRLVNMMVVERSARDDYYRQLKKKHIVLSFSGGLDSTTVLHWAARLFGGVTCLVFDYGQRHSVEIDMAFEYLKKNSKFLSIEFECGIESKMINMSPINTLATSSLTRKDINTPRNQSQDEIAEGIPNTFVPGRNIYFMTAIAQAAYDIDATHIAMGVNVLDYSGYPDCRPEFISAMRDAITIGIFNNRNIGVHAPLMMLDKKSIIRLGMHLDVDYAHTHSCYNGVKGGCGECDSCLIRRKAFRELGKEDPAIDRWLQSD